MKLSIALGNPKHGVYEAAKEGRAMIRETARKMGVTAPLIDTVSMPIGADEVSVIEHSASYSVFANGGKRVFPYAAVEIRNSRGDVIYNHDSDGRQPERIFPEQAIITMDSMLTKVVEEGTGKRAILPGIKVGGKTGTTNGYKDAWFCGFTANLNGCVWFGNDDDTSMGNMTGGSLPAQTWHDIMEFAHRGLELKPMPGFPLDASPAVATASPNAATPSSPGQAAAPSVLTRRSGEALGAVEKLFRASEDRRAALGSQSASRTFRALDVEDGTH